MYESICLATGAFTDMGAAVVTEEKQRIYDYYCDYRFYPPRELGDLRTDVRTL